MRAPLWLWLVLLIGTPLLLAVDLFVIYPRHRRGRHLGPGLWSLVWLAFGLALTPVVGAIAGETLAIKYTTGFLVEKGLDLDQVFVFALVVAAYKAPAPAASRAVLWALVVGVLLRIPFVLLGYWLGEHGFGVAEAVILGAFVLAGVYLVRTRHDEADPLDNRFARLMSRTVEVEPAYVGKAFVVRRDRRRLFTLAGVLLVVLFTADIYFAATVPMVFAFTKPPFLVVASTCAALLGWGSLYAWASTVEVEPAKVKVGMAVVLWLVAADLVSYWIRKSPPTWVLPVLIAVTIAVPIAASVRARSKAAGAASGAGSG